MKKTIEQIKAENLGNNIIKWLSLKKNKDGRIDTIWGDKTPIGLGFSLERIFKEGKI